MNDFKRHAFRDNGTQNRHANNNRRPQRSAPPGPPADDGTSEKLHKVLARAGLGSRRAMEQLIAGGHLTVNGKPASIGLRIGPRDLVRLDGRVLKLKFTDEHPRILLYHKPEGEIVSRDDPGERPTVFEKLPNVRGGKWIAAGRLDLNSSGLMIFSTSGELANRLMHPSFEVEREYAARIMGELTQEQKEKLLSGIELDDGPAKFDSLAEGGGEGSNRWYNVVLHEGRNREVRRLFEALGLTVSRLIRVRHGVIRMPPRLRRGQMQELPAGEVMKVLKWVGLETRERARDGDRQPTRERNPRAGAHTHNPRRPPHRPT